MKIYFILTKILYEKYYRIICSDEAQIYLESNKITTILSIWIQII